YAFIGDLSTLPYYPLVSKSYLDSLKITYNFVNDYTGVINATASGTYNFYCNSATNDSTPAVTMSVVIDDVPPTVTNVTPSGIDIALSTSTIVIAFSEAMDTGGTGTVTCNNGATLAFSGWSSGNTVVTYNITSGSLALATTYTVSISGFKDVVGNVMDADASNTFTTVKASPNITISADPAAGQTYPGNVTLTATLSGAQPSNSGQTITFTDGGSTYTATTNASGTATYTILSPIPGTYTLGASFASDTYNNAATANSISGYNVGKGTLTAGDFGFSPLTDTYNGTSKTVTPSHSLSGIGAITVYYDGLTTAPTAAGTYMITIDVAEPMSGGSCYNAATNLSLGNFVINPAAITVEPDAGQNKVYYQLDPASYAYSITSGTLYGIDAFSGSLDRDPGEDAGLYEITQGDLTLGSNYNLTFTSGVFFEITKAAITVEPDAGQNKVYYQLDPASYAYSITSGTLYGIDAFSGSLDRIPGEDVGPYEITQGDLTAGGNYDLTFTPGVFFEITKAAITVEPDAGQKKILNEGDPVFTYTITSGTLYGTDAFSGSLDRDPGEDVGTYEITQGDLTAGGNYDLTFTRGVFFDIIKGDPKEYVITATASGGAVISPEGNVTVIRGKNVTFFFSASSVAVNGVPLSADDVALGYYTFGDVMMNHTIDATGTSPRTAVHLYINVGEGGNAEYSVNGSPFTKYTSSVTVMEGSSIVLKAVAENGYKFKEWKEGSIVYGDAEITFSGVAASIDISLIFEEDNGSEFPLLIVAGIVLLVVLVVLAALFMRKGKV
ncbi:MAG: hypothetical protein FWG41_05105, partial [Methanomassiliicoccaceae archaeon]|nr:hypothetical protein [Methanomassiliicoccaceae archaeon]